MKSATRLLVELLVAISEVRVYVKSADLSSPMADLIKGGIARLSTRAAS